MNTKEPSRNNTAKHESIQLPPSDLPQDSFTGHSGPIAEIASPKGIKWTFIIFAIGIILAIGILATANIIADNNERNSVTQEATNASNKEYALIMAQEKAWNAVEPETIPVIGKSFMDDFGHKVVVNRVIKNFKAPTPNSQWELTEEGKKQIVLVEYSISKVASKIIGPAPTVLDLKVKSNNGPVAKITNTSLSEEMTKKGYVSLGVIDVKDGQVHTGFVPYVLAEDSPLTILCRTGKSIVSIGSPSIPEKDYELVVY